MRENRPIFLLPGKLVTSKEESQITTILGSCVGIALYDRHLQIGGLNHYLIPELPPNAAPSPRYGSVAIPQLIQELENQGAKRQNLQAKVYGGGNVVGALTQGVRVGERNVETALAILEENRIPILEKNVLGDKGRKITMNTKTFEVTHTLQAGNAHTKKIDLTGLGSIDTAEGIRVLIVDDSATVRTIFSKIFKKGGLDVVGVACDAYEARELIAKTKPSVITLDIEMPKMSGVAFLEKLMTHHPLPVVMVSSLGADGAAAMKSLELGAVEFVNKPTQFQAEGLRNLAKTLIEKVKAAASSSVLKNRKVSPKPDYTTLGSRKSPATPLSLIAIGGNTGSQNHIAQILTHLPPDTPPVLVANSTVTPYLKEYIDKLKNQVSVSLKEAKNGENLVMGTVYFAPANHHLTLQKSGSGYQVSLETGAAICNQLPSIEKLFTSVAENCGEQAAAVLLGGFGRDGVIGLDAISNQGGVTIAQDPTEASFPYIPQAAIEAGIVDQVLKANEIHSAIMQARNRSAA